MIKTIHFRPGDVLILQSDRRPADADLRDFLRAVKGTALENHVVGISGDITVHHIVRAPGK